MRFLCLACFWIVPLAAQAADFRVTFVSPGGKTGFWGEVASTMAAAASDLNADLEVLYADRKPYAMAELLSRRLAEGDPPDYFILVNENQAGARLMQLMEGSSSKVLFLLNKLTPSQKDNLERRNIDLHNVIASIIPDNETAGYEMAESLFEALRQAAPGRDRYRLLALTGDTSTPAGLQRELGMIRAVADNDDVTLMHAIPVSWSEDTAYERAGTALGRGRIDAIWGANDDIALGAGRAAAESGRTAGRDVFLAGLNWSQRGMEAVRDGRMTMTHGGHFFAGAWIMVMLRDYHFRTVRGEMSVDVMFKMSPITRENVDMYLDRLGDGDWDRIDFRRFCKTINGDSHYDFSAEAILSAAAGS
ncbi:MAG: ABC transporter substrate-binding protein [Roseibium sp.]